MLITSVELNLFICYQWNIPQNKFNVTISTSASYRLLIDEIILGNLMVDLNQSNCNSSRSFVINLSNTSTSANYNVKIVSQAALNRLYIGEIPFPNQTLYNCSSKFY